MKQIAQNYQVGWSWLGPRDVPAGRRPAPGGVLVRSLFSPISTGTEMMKVSEASLSMVGNGAWARPDQVKKGPRRRRAAAGACRAPTKKVMNKLDLLHAARLLSALAGVVTEFGKGAEEFKVGQLVACAGNEQALHAELQLGAGQPVRGRARRGAAPSTPRSCDRCRHRDAGRATRRGPTRRDRRRHRPRPDRPARRPAARGGRRPDGRHRPGARALPPGGEIGRRRLRVAGRPPTDVRRRAGRRSPAASGAPTTCSSSAAWATATARLKWRPCGWPATAGPGSSTSARCKLDLPKWNAYYEEGTRRPLLPGPTGPAAAMTPGYELEGVDYPAGYVRWTEKRNLESFLDLVARNELEVASLIDGVFPMTDAVKVYEDLARRRNLRRPSASCSSTLRPRRTTRRGGGDQAGAPGREARIRSENRLWSERADRDRFRRSGQLRKLHAPAAPGQAAGG